MENRIINSSQTTESPHLSLGFKTEPYWTRKFLSICVLLIVGFAAGLTPKILANPSWVPALMSIAVLAVVLTALLIGRWFALKKEVPAIRFDAAGIHLPRNAHSKKIVHLNYDELQSIDVRGKGWMRMLVLGNGKRNFVFPVSRLEQGGTDLMASIKACLQQHSGAENLWQRLEEKQTFTKTFMETKPYFSYVIVVALALAYLIEWSTGALSDGFGLARLGANAPMLVDQGQWYRLFTANFLHANFTHIYFNAISLLFLAPILERIVGLWKTVNVFLISCLAGSFTSYLAANAFYSVGASTGVFGLLGALAVVNWRLGRKLPVGFAQTKQWWIFILGLNAISPLVIPQVDWAAHLGGFASGILVMLALLPKQSPTLDDLPAIDLIQSWRQSSAWVPPIAIALVLLYTLAIGKAVNQYADRFQSVDLLTRSFLAQPDKSSDDINSWAWSVALNADRAGDRTNLDEAVRLLRPVIENHGQAGKQLSNANMAATLDTYASLKYLQGEYHQAVLLEKQAMRTRFKTLYLSQYAHFLERRQQTLGVFDAEHIGAEHYQIQRTEVDRGMTELTLVQRQNYQQPVAVIVGIESKAGLLGAFVCTFRQVHQLTILNSDKLFGLAVTDLNFPILSLETEPKGKRSKSDRCSSVKADTSGLRS